MLGYAVSTEIIQTEAIKIAISRNIPAHKLKGSCGWIQPFMCRHGLSIRAARAALATFGDLAWNNPALPFTSNKQN
jgi:hypothetical protein